MLQGCGTAVPRSFKARNVPITTITEAKAMCKQQETVCGIPGREKSFHFECIDVNIAGDSCMYPQFFYHHFVTNYAIKVVVA